MHSGDACRIAVEVETDQKPSVPDDDDMAWLRRYLERTRPDREKAGFCTHIPGEWADVEDSDASDDVEEPDEVAETAVVPGDLPGVTNARVQSGLPR